MQLSPAFQSNIEQDLHKFPGPSEMKINFKASVASLDKMEFSSFSILIWSTAVPQ
jgi:hypothetical protein